MQIAAQAPQSVGWLMAQRSGAAVLDAQAGLCSDPAPMAPVTTRPPDGQSCPQGRTSEGIASALRGLPVEQGRQSPCKPGPASWKSPLVPPGPSGSVPTPRLPAHLPPLSSLLPDVQLRGLLSTSSTKLIGNPGPLHVSPLQGPPFPGPSCDWLLLQGPERSSWVTQITLPSLIGALFTSVALNPICNFPFVDLFARILSRWQSRLFPVPESCMHTSGTQ